MPYHILNGDALKSQFPTKQISGSLIVARECLIDGPIDVPTLDEFWKQRAIYIKEAFESDEDYFVKVVSEFEQIKEIETGAEICLWFDEDLFCLFNLCFSVSLIKKYVPSASYYWIKPSADNWWGYGGMSQEDLVKAFEEKISLDESYVDALIQTWEALQKKDFGQLRRLASHLSNIFPQIEEVVAAHIERFPQEKEWGRPFKRIASILQASPDLSFGKLFREFGKTEGIYGFGDSQVKRMYEEVKRFHH